MLLVSLLHVIGLIAVQCLCSACCVVHVVCACLSRSGKWQGKANT